MNDDNNNPIDNDNGTGDQVNACECPPGFEQVGKDCVPDDSCCPPGFEQVGKDCVPIGGPTGCSDGYELVDGECVLSECVPGENALSWEWVPGEQGSETAAPLGIFMGQSAIGGNTSNALEQFCVHEFSFVPLDGGSGYAGSGTWYVSNSPADAWATVGTGNTLVINQSVGSLIELAPTFRVKFVSSDGRTVIYQVYLDTANYTILDCDDSYLGYVVSSSGLYDGGTRGHWLLNLNSTSHNFVDANFSCESEDDETIGVTTSELIDSNTIKVTIDGCGVLDCTIDVTCIADGSTLTLDVPLFEVPLDRCETCDDTVEPCGVPCEPSTFEVPIIRQPYGAGTDSYILMVDLAAIPEKLWCLNNIGWATGVNADGNNDLTLQPVPTAPNNWLWSNAIDAGLGGCAYFKADCGCDTVQGELCWDECDYMIISSVTDNGDGSCTISVVISNSTLTVDSYQWTLGEGLTLVSGELDSNTVTVSGNGDATITVTVDGCDPVEMNFGLDKCKEEAPCDGNFKLVENYIDINSTRISELTVNNMAVTSFVLNGNELVTNPMYLVHNLINIGGSPYVSSMSDVLTHILANTDMLDYATAIPGVPVSTTGNTEEKQTFRFWLPACWEFSIVVSSNRIIDGVNQLVPTYKWEDLLYYENRNVNSGAVNWVEGGAFGTSYFPEVDGSSQVIDTKTLYCIPNNGSNCGLSINNAMSGDDCFVDEWVSIVCNDTTEIITQFQVDVILILNGAQYIPTGTTYTASIGNYDPNTNIWEGSLAPGQCVNIRVRLGVPVYIPGCQEGAVTVGHVSNINSIIC